MRLTLSGSQAPEIVEPADHININNTMQTNKSKSTARELAEIVAGAVAMLAMVDAIGFMAWIASGQTPADGFYIGRITAEVLRAIIF